MDQGPLNCCYDISSDWDIIFEDEFDYANLDGSKWNFEIWPAGWTADRGLVLQTPGCQAGSFLSFWRFCWASQKKIVEEKMLIMIIKKWSWDHYYSKYKSFIWSVLFKSFVVKRRKLSFSEKGTYIKLKRTPHEARSFF